MSRVVSIGVSSVCAVAVIVGVTSCKLGKSDATTDAAADASDTAAATASATPSASASSSAAPPKTHAAGKPCKGYLIKGHCSIVCQTMSDDECPDPKERCGPWTGTDDHGTTAMNAPLCIYDASNEPLPKKGTPSLECRAKNEGGVIELSLAWDKNTAKGTLTSDGKSRPVIAELYKGLVLVDPPGSSPVTGKLATVTTDGKKTIRVGDYKQPTHDCN
jgi:hypothetical protein